MQLDNSNLVLIGMPGSGKSTVGVILAKLSSKNFIDADVLIQTETGHTLQEIVDEQGYHAFRSIEEQVLLSLRVENHVISTGGSAVYSEAAMRHLKKNGIVVFLDVTLDTLHKRIHNFDSRGIARRSDQSFEDLFTERYALYSHYADITIDCNALSTEAVSEAILAAYRKMLV